MNESPKFICDDMVGRLSKWLRILGYDTTYFSSQGIAPDILNARVAALSRSEDRIVLTRDSNLPKHKFLKGALVLQSESVLDQLKEVLVSFKLLPIDSKKLYSRCLICNHEVRALKKEKALHHVPDYVYQTHEHFHECPSCGKIYWAGTHIERMQKTLHELLSNLL